MKGIILAGGMGTRLAPLTHITNKHLLPVYDKPMILYPLETLKKAGLKEIMIVTGKEHAGHFMHFLGSGNKYGVRLSYALQDSASGIAGALSLAENFSDKGRVAVILGDNIFEDNFTSAIKNFKKGGHIFAKEVPDPERFGVVKFDKNRKATKIVEKPKEFLSSYAITGLYIFDNRVVEAAKKLKPSARGELEITDLHNWYLKKGELKVDLVKGEWIDAGTFDTLLKASNWAKGQVEK